MDHNARAIILVRAGATKAVSGLGKAQRRIAAHRGHVADTERSRRGRQRLEQRRRYSTAHLTLTRTRFSERFCSVRTRGQVAFVGGRRWLIGCRSIGGNSSLTGRRQPVSMGNGGEQRRQEPTYVLRWATSSNKWRCAVRWSRAVAGWREAGTAKVRAVWGDVE
ncbi:hypothetical protein HYPSUDRAFT_561369 [Hypholoma sublateritium FD-334 SS-4]|uniref:Uncharacterized protein n=1 Tax=Hypholoma sublateritium (strain FD-334 SS-4) TaxID=945553 RepID=A0A0D2NYR8_HYPSF|nr:hypothetical protein HYPSUDRAFT_561369 [Hypholoma sublateritium FD-334 SS-4]